MRACAGIPWRSADRHRARSCKRVIEHLKSADLPVITGDSDLEGQPFHRAAARNRLARSAEQLGYDWIILHDADMIAPVGAYEQMLKLAELTDSMVVGYTEYRALDERTTTQVLNSPWVDPFTVRPAGTTYAWSLGGIVVISVDNFHRVGGYDERFVGWGCEDTAFAIACGVVLGPNQRTANSAVHLWHQHGMVTVDHAQLEANGQLLAEYNAVTDVAGLRLVQGIG